jgi:SAM-dependent methyltransferase
VTGAPDWDRRYAASDLVWSVDANQFVVEVCRSLTAGRALDLAAGEGRNSIWLASLGWQVTAVDFSQVALDKGRRLAAARGTDIDDRVVWVAADLATYQPESSGFDLVIVAYLQVPAALRRTALATAGAAVAPGGRLVIVAHDRTNLDHGVGGPQDPDVLYGPDDVIADLDGSGLVIARAGRVPRFTDQAPDAIDLLVTAERPQRNG